MLKPYNQTLVGFFIDGSKVLGFVEISTTFIVDTWTKSILTKLLVVEGTFIYNLTVGRPILNVFRAMVSTPHLVMKFPLENGKIFRQCYVNNLKRLQIDQEGKHLYSKEHKEE